MSLPSPYDVNTIAEVVPDVARVSSKLSASSVLQQRKRVRFIPSSGQRYDTPSSSTQINWTIQDTGYLDLQSASISFRVETYDAQTTLDASGALVNAKVALDDGAWSVLSRLQLSDNSILLEDMIRPAVKANAELYAQADQSWYESVGSIMGLWKHAGMNALTMDGSAGANPGLPVNGKYQVFGKQSAAAARTQVFPQSAGATPAENRALKNQVTIPLSLLSDFFRESTLFPLRNAGQMFLALTLANPAEACYVTGTGVATAVPKYRIMDVTLDADVIVAHPTYVSLLDSICNNESEEGLKFPFQATLLASQNIAGGATGAGTQSINFAKASQNLRSIHMVFQSQQGLSTPRYPGQSTFANPGVDAIQVRVGSEFFPSIPDSGYARQYSSLMNLFGAPSAVVGQAAIADILNYNTASGIDSTGAENTTYAAPWNGRLAGVDGQASNSRCCDCYAWGYSFDKLKRAKLTKALDLDGINSLSAGGSVLTVEMTTQSDKAMAIGANAGAANANGVVATALIKYTRILEMKNGAVRVLG